jgi:hypothetical protein
MTRTDVMASSRPQTVRAALNTKRSRRAPRRLALAPLALFLTIALVGPTAAFAAGEATTGYSQTPPPPTTTPTTTTPTTTTPSTGTSPEKETSTPTSTNETSPTKTSSTPTETEKTGTLPFTGFDLRWSLGFGLVLMGAGFAIVVVQRRQRRQDGR